MKIRNVDLQNTPLLTNNIFKQICLKAPSLSELEKKVKEYEILLVRCLTNAYRLSKISLDKKSIYTKLPDGTYKTTIHLNFSGIKKNEITNPEKTLRDIKRLTGMESKRESEKGEYSRTKYKVKSHHNTIFIPFEIEEGASEIDIISKEQRQILEKLVTDTNLIKVEFFIAMKKRNFETKTTTISLKVDYDYREIIEIPITHSNQDEIEDR